MNIVGDAFTVGVVLLLIIGAVAFYLYTRLAQVEKHMNLLESILLDLKVATENSFMGFPGFAMPPSPGAGGGRTAADDDEMGMDVNEDELEGVLADNFIPTIHEDGEGSGEDSPTGSESPVGIEDITEVGGDDDANELEKMLEEVDNAPESNVRVVALSGEAQAVLADKGVHVHKIEPQYETMSVKELKQLAHNRAIKGSSKMSRTEIIEALRKKDSGVEEGVASTVAASSFNSTAFFGDAAAVIDA
jgi:hypothetical protein